MNVQNSEEARAYELEYPRRESSGRRAFIGLAAGTYYLPIYSNPGDGTIGPYTLTVSTSACSP